MTWIYSGGGCENSWNVQGEKFICEDFNGGPPTTIGEKSFIVVTDADGEFIYHRDWVTVNSLYEHNSGGERFSADSIITIYKNNNTGDLANLLQSIQYHSSCSQTLFLKNRFGANILVEWTNEEQGTISCFANQTFNLEVDIPVEFEGGPATVTGLTVASNVDPFFFNLTDDVAGVVVNAGDTFQTTINVPIDLTEKRTYNMLITLTADTAGGQICTATDIVTFTAGYPLPPIFPTFSPTQAPSGSSPGQGSAEQPPAAPAAAPTGQAPTGQAPTAQATIVDIAAGNPDFSTLVDLVTQAGLVDTLSGSGPFTVFAPTNAAFAALPQETLDAVLSDSELLTSVLTYHVVEGKVLSNDLEDGAAVATVNGANVFTSTDPPMVNDANIVAADVLASNGVIHGIDAVSFPYLFSYVLVNAILCYTCI